MVARRRSSFTRKVNNFDSPLPERRYFALAVTENRERWFVRYDLIGDRVVGSMFNGSELVRKTFNVGIEFGAAFHVDVGTGSGVKIKFIHRQKED